MPLPSLQITVALSELRVTKTRYTWIRYRSTREVKEDPGDRQQFLAAVIQASHNAFTKQTESQEIFRLRTVYVKSTRNSLVYMSFLITESTTYVC